MITRTAAAALLAGAIATSGCGGARPQPEAEVGPIHAVMPIEPLQPVKPMQPIQPMSPQKAPPPVFAPDDDAPTCTTERQSKQEC
ncbi:MAG: hypothetical protein ACM30I_16620 [Gemmatimonas sp.]